MALPGVLTKYPRESDLQKWTKELAEPKLSITQIDAGDRRASVTLASLVGGDVGSSEGSTLRVEGENARRVQIYQ